MLVGDLLGDSEVWVSPSRISLMREAGKHRTVGQCSLGNWSILQLHVRKKSGRVSSEASQVVVILRRSIVNLIVGRSVAGAGLLRNGGRGWSSFRMNEVGKAPTLAIINRTRYIQGPSAHSTAKLLIFFSKSQFHLQSRRLTESTSSMTMMVAFTTD